jgi:heme-degrading monooxygenase HmoA
MFARVATIEAKPNKVDDSIRYFRENVIATAKKFQGFKEAYLMVDRKTGKTMSVVLWETEKDLKASAAKADEIMAERLRVAGISKKQNYEIYEVAVAEVPTAAGMR